MGIRVLPAAVFFDLFETLVTEGERALPSGIPIDVYRRVRAETRHAAMTGQLSYRDILRKTGVAPESIGDLRARRVAEKAAFLTNVEQRVLDCLRQIRATGTRIAIISNCSADETAAWSNSPLSTLTDDVVFSHRVGLVKPDPAIYRLACERLDVAPVECMFVGDGGSDELRGAAEIGMRAYQAGWYVTRQTEFATVDEPRELIALLDV